VSGSSSSENASASPFTFFTELVKVVKANTEVMIRLERNSRLVTDDFDTGTDFDV
jgi:hypothetical protein